MVTWGVPKACMNQDRETSSINLTELSEQQQLGSPSAPRLRKFRLLQLLAIAAALIWVIAGLLVSNHLIQKELSADLLASQTQLDNEVRFRERIFEQNLHQAEQLSRTLALNQSYIALAKAAKAILPDLDNLDRPQRVTAISKLPNVDSINTSFRQLVSQIDAYQIFMQDARGYCIASGRSGEDDDCMGLRYDTREYFREAEATGHGRQFAIGRLHTIPSFFFSTAIREGDEFLGVIIVRLLTSDVTDFINLNLALTLVTAEDGVVIASSEPSFIFHHVGPDWSPVPALEEFREIYSEEQIRTIPVQEIKNSRLDSSLWLWQERCHLVGQGNVPESDFQVLLFRDVEHILAGATRLWELSISILLVGLLLILLIERSMNFSQQRKAHVEALSEANKKLADVSGKLYELTITDSLTGVSSRRYFNQRLEDEVKRQQRQPHTGISLLVLDIDKFKKINDRYGHPAGDEAIRTMADICAHSVRSFDVVGRLGGEEFGVILFDLTPEQSTEIAERILRKCRETEIRFQEHRFKQTCSIGLARLKEGQSADQLLSEADKALYQAKHQGRNCYVCA